MTPSQAMLIIATTGAGSIDMLAEYASRLIEGGHYSEALRVLVEIGAAARKVIEEAREIAEGGSEEVH